MKALPSRRQFVTACLWVLVLLAATFIMKGVISTDYSADSIYLSVSLNSPVDGVAALYYDVGKGFNDNDIVFVSIRGGGKDYDYLFKMPNKTIYNLRMNLLLLTNDVISFRKIEILDGFRRLARRLDPGQLEPFHQIRRATVSDTTADFKIQKGANDPQIRIRLESPLSVKWHSSLFLFVGGLFLEFLGLFLSTCLLITFWSCQRDKVIAAVVVVAFVFFGWRCWYQYDNAKALFLQVAMTSSVNGTAQVYYDLGKGFNEHQIHQEQIFQGEALRQYRFKLPNKKIYGLRFDPIMTGGKAHVGEIGVADVYGTLLHEIPLREMEPANQIKAINYNNDGAEITIPEGANDPQIVLPLKEPLDFENKLPFPIWQWLWSLMIEAVLYILLALAFILTWRRWRNLFSEGLDSPCAGRGTQP